MPPSPGWNPCLAGRICIQGSACVRSGNILSSAPDWICVFSFCRRGEICISALWGTTIRCELTSETSRNSPTTPLTVSLSQRNIFPNSPQREQRHRGRALRAVRRGRRFRVLLHRLSKPSISPSCWMRSCTAPELAGGNSISPVSYTHLTLPTKRIV